MNGVLTRDIAKEQLAVPESAMDHSQTFTAGRAISAHPLEANIISVVDHVSCGPQADIPVFSPKVVQGGKARCYDVTGFSARISAKVSFATSSASRTRGAPT